MLLAGSEGSGWLLRGFLILLAYVLVSNTLYLLLGTHLLQFLPGVNATGFRGTLRLAAAIVLAGLGLVRWGVLSVLRPSKGRFTWPVIQSDIATMIQAGSRSLKSILVKLRVRREQQ